MDEIKEEETEKEPVAEIVPEKMKVSFKNKMILLAIFGILLGFVIKTEAAKKITVGFEDYKLLGVEKLYDINDLQKGLELQKKLQEEEQQKAENEALEAAKKARNAESDKTTCDVGAGETCE